MQTSQKDCAIFLLLYAKCILNKQGLVLDKVRFKLKILTDRRKKNFNLIFLF